MSDSHTVRLPLAKRRLRTVSARMFQLTFRPGSAAGEWGTPRLAP